MKLTEEQQKICDKYSAHDEEGFVHCHECPLAINHTYHLCLKSATRHDLKEYGMGVWMSKEEIALEEAEKMLRFGATDKEKVLARVAIEAIKVLEQTRWIPVTERHPKNEQEVEITYTRKHWKTGELLYFTCRAFYTDGTMNTEDSNYAWNNIDNWEYDENLDAYIIPTGWWEVGHFADEFGCVDQPVVAWRPLLDPYKAGDEE